VTVYPEVIDPLHDGDHFLFGGQSGKGRAGGEVTPLAGGLPDENHADNSDNYFYSAHFLSLLRRIQLNSVKSLRSLSSFGSLGSFDPQI
jgi:hypothetical protein